MQTTIFCLIMIIIFKDSQCLLPPKFQWKTIDFAWEGNAREAALKSGAYIPEHNMPTGIERWKDKLFVTIPRWKRGVPASLNYIYLNGSQSQPLNPYPSWGEAFVSKAACCISANSTVVSTFRVHVDRCDRLWVVDNGVADMTRELRQVTPPAILVFDLNTDKLVHRYEIKDELLRDSSVLTSIVVDTVGKGCEDVFAYIPDMGSNALLVYSLAQREAWRVEHHYFHFDPHAAVYKVGGVDFNWSDGVSSAVLSPTRKASGFRELYFHPTSSTKQFRMSTKFLRDKNVPQDNIFSGVEVVGERGAKSQATACDLDPNSNVMFYTQLSKNGVSCWNMDKPLTEENVPLIISDCTVLEFPSDIKVDHGGNLWILSNRQSRFIYESMDFSQVNFRILTAPVKTIIQDTPCEKLSTMGRALSFIRPKSNKKSLNNSTATSC
ncbi:protein yellow-like [Pararge aegeria]|uniref:Jg20995 protein n=1 Tax=Pararge aegeria aegeria TaxID=348720 RepID=A0A8S4RC67_9NEOP|nr:protein yellow-like [Pararge aegeria]CAH2232402.1 jg20995 [Pararge aegeria aegeria]